MRWTSGTPWDGRSARALAAARDAAVEEQLRDVIGPFSPYWRDAVRTARAQGRRGLDALAAVPPTGERDVCPDGDPAQAAALVVQAGERGYALHAPGPRLRRALSARVVDRDAYRRVVEADTRPTSYVRGGLAVPLLLASTRSDLDLVARAGARLWAVLGLDRGDVLVSALPSGPTAEGRALELAALASGAPALAAGERPADVAAALALLPATVLAVAPAAAPPLLHDLRAAGVLGALRTVLLVGAPTAEQRAAVQEAGRGVAVLACHAPSGARVLWGECRESAREGAPALAGFHTYPDLDHVEVGDPETGAVLPAGSTGGELLLTQLGFRGSALVRWRTGDLVGGGAGGGVAGGVPIGAVGGPTGPATGGAAGGGGGVVTEEPCPACGRRVPRVTGAVAAAALVPRLALAAGERRLDLRRVTGALTAVAGLAAWRVEVRRSARSGLDQLVVHVEPTGDAVAAAVEVARDVRRAAGLLPTQVVVAPLDPRGGGVHRGRLRSAGAVP